VRRNQIGVLAVAAATALILTAAGLVGGGWGRPTGAVAGADPSATATDGPSGTPTDEPAIPTDGPSSPPTSGPTHSSSAATVGPRVGRRLTEPAATATARLTRELKGAVHPLLPPSTLRPVTIQWVAGPQTHQPLVVSRYENVYIAFADVRDARGTGSLDFHLGSYIGDNPKRPFDRYCAVIVEPMTSCETRIGPRGELITVEIGHPSAGSPIVEYRVDLAKADGTALVAVARDVGYAGNVNDGPAGRPNPPLTVDQMIDILLSPGLTLFP
jgi:hypothetical protein